MKEKHKLSPPWEGPYTVTEVVRSGTYQLEDNNGNLLNNTWNIEQLRCFSPKFGLNHFFVRTRSRKSTPARNTFSPGRSRGSMYNILILPLFLLSHDKAAVSPNRNTFHSLCLPYVTLFLLPTKHTPPFPMVTNS